MVGHTGAVNTVAVDQFGRFAVTGGMDGTGRVWDLQTGTCTQLLLGHTSLGKLFTTFHWVLKWQGRARSPLTSGRVNKGEDHSGLQDSTKRFGA